MNQRSSKTKIPHSDANANSNERRSGGDRAVPPPFRRFHRPRSQYPAPDPPKPDFTNPAYLLYWHEHVRNMADLTPLTRHIFAQVIEDQKALGYSYRSQRKMAACCVCSIRTVVSSLRTLSADGSIKMVARYRLKGRGRTSSRIFVNFEHDRWKGCKSKVAVTSTPQTSCGNVLSAISADASLRENFFEPVSLANASVVENAIPVPPVDQRSDQGKTIPRKVKAAPSDSDPELVRDFRLGAQYRNMPMPEILAVYVLTLLAANQLDPGGFLRWVKNNHSPHKARHDPAFGLWRKFVEKAACVPDVQFDRGGAYYLRLRAP